MNRIAFALASACALSFVALVDGCSGSSDALTGGDAGGGDASTADDGGGSGDDAAPPDAAPPQTITFSYTPSWSGVKAVTVVGGFGQMTDWGAMTPFATLVNDGSGKFTGTAALPSGDYLYVFKVIGDSAAAAPDTFSRYALDPASAAFAPCPMQSPTFDKNAPNPCSKLTVPSTTAALRHVRGTVLRDGQPVAGYLVVLERDEAMSHHFFVDRVTTTASGAFDLAAAPGQYRLQVLHPTYLAQSDAMRDPIALEALRRSISSAFSLAVDVTVDGPDVAFHDYATFAPRGDAGAALPTHFTFGDGGAPARLTIYGTGMNGASGEIGDPWYAGVATGGGADFDGGFNTKQANETAAKAGERYFWGIESTGARPDGGVGWTAQTMVFPITWQ